MILTTSTNDQIASNGATMSNFQTWVSQLEWSSGPFPLLLSCCVFCWDPSELIRKVRPYFSYLCTLLQCSHTYSVAFISIPYASSLLSSLLLHLVKSYEIFHMSIWKFVLNTSYTYSSVFCGRYLCWGSMICSNPLSVFCTVATDMTPDQAEAIALDVSLFNLHLCVTPSSTVGSSPCVWKPNSCLAYFVYLIKICCSGILFPVECVWRPLTSVTHNTSIFSFMCQIYMVAF